MALDIERVATKSPLLQGHGFLLIIDAAKIIGLSVNCLLGELHDGRPDGWTQAQHWDPVCSCLGLGLS